jgi:hypothetical protein
MQMLYNSDSFVVVQFDLPGAADAAAADGPALRRGGFEIVDKHAQREIWIEGALAERFQRGVQELVAAGPTQEALDEFIGGFTALAQHPLVLH